MFRTTAGAACVFSRDTPFQSIGTRRRKQTARRSNSLFGVRNAAGTGAGNGDTVEPTISDDGTHVAFRSNASDLISGGDTNGKADVWNYQDFCKTLDSGDNFKIGPILRPLDYYIQFFTLGDSLNIQSSLQALIDFLDSQRTPERRKAA